MELSLNLIDAASAFLNDKSRVTPLEFSYPLSELLGVPAFLKLENLQLTGSFKVRGAFFRLSQLTPEEKSIGVITSSAGNHGKAIAFVAKELKVPATIYVPKNIDKSKLRGMQAYGAEVILSESVGYDATENLAKKAAKQTGRPFISAFEDPFIMAGNGGPLLKKF